MIDDKFGKCFPAVTKYNLLKSGAEIKEDIKRVMENEIAGSHFVWQKQYDMDFELYFVSELFYHNIKVT